MPGLVESVVGHPQMNSLVDSGDRYMLFDVLLQDGDGLKPFDEHMYGVIQNGQESSWDVQMNEVNENGNGLKALDWQIDRVSENGHGLNTLDVQMNGVGDNGYELKTLDVHLNGVSDNGHGLKALDVEMNGVGDDGHGLKALDVQLNGENDNGNGLKPNLQIDGEFKDGALIKVDHTVATPDVQPNRRRRKKSIVWQYFTIVPISPDCSKATCNQCQKPFAYITGKKQAGTSHLKRHIELGICQANRRDRDTKQLALYSPGSEHGTVRAPPRKRCRASPVMSALNQERYAFEMARMIIMHNYPIQMVEQPGFIDLARTLQPHLPVVSFDSVHEEILSIYKTEKGLLRDILAGIPGRVSITMDLWTSDQTVGYVVLTGHFVDADWKLQSRVLNFFVVPFPDSEVAFNHAVVSCLSEWGLESKLLTLTLDQSFASDKVVDNLRGLLSLKKSHTLNGRFLIVECFARYMARLSQDALEALSVAVRKVRNSVKYVTLSESREEKFKELRKQLRVPSGKCLVIDNKEKWDSTYHMLSTAFELKEVFSCLGTSDLHYKEDPSEDEWTCIGVLCSYLKLFYDAAGILTSQTYPSANKIFHEVYKIQLELMNGVFSEDPWVSNFVRPLHEKFDKFWSDCCVVLAMSVAMDPRYKLKLVQFTFVKIYGEQADTWIRAVDDGIHELFFEYIAQTLPLPEIDVEQRNEGFVKVEDPDHHETSVPSSDGLSDFDVYISEISGNNHGIKSELDLYLDESLARRDLEDFDVLEWWKKNRIKYPTLSKMAADLLSIPMSTVARDSVFDTVCNKVDSYRCSLRPSTLEALVCANNWLRHSSLNKSSEICISTKKEA